MALKKIKMTALQLSFPENSGLTHTATSWQVSKGLDFDTAENIVVQSLNDTNNLLSYVATIDVEDNVPLYGRHMMHIKKNNIDMNVSWSRITPFNSNMKGMKINNFMVRTPKISASTEEGKLVATTSDFDMFSGAGEHFATNWNIKDTYGQDIWIRKLDKSNKTNISINDLVEAGNGYVIEASHTNNFNNDSFKGREILLNYSADLNLFEFSHPEEFIIDRQFWYRIKLYTSLEVAYDIEIRDMEGNVVKSKQANRELVDYIYLDGMEVYKTYAIYVRLKFEDGKVTQFKKVFEDLLLYNRRVQYKPFVNYLEQLEAYNDINTDGIASVTTRETYDGRIFLPSFNGDYIDLYTVYNTKLKKQKMIKLKTVANFTYSLHTDYANMIQLPNHNIIVDAMMFNDIEHEATMFAEYEYNPIKLELTLKRILKRPKEQYATSVSCSLDTLRDNTILYVPAFYSITEDANRDKLPLFKVNYTDFALSEPIALPFDAVANVSLVVDKDNQVFIFGGSEDNTYSKDASSNMEYWERTNNNIYKYDPDTDKFTIVATIPDEYSKDIYALQGFLRLDGKIVIFNGSHSGPGMKIQEELVFDPSDYSIYINKTDMDWDIPFRNNIVRNNGCITRVSSKVTDPQKAYTYISNVKNEDTITRIDGSENVITDLVVDSGKVVNVEDLYQFDTVTIRGTGVIRWFRPQGILELTSSDLIITRDRTMTESEIHSGRWHNILVMEGVNFQVEQDLDSTIDPTPDPSTPTITYTIETADKKTGTTSNEVSIEKGNDVIDYNKVLTLKTNCAYFTVEVEGSGPSATDAKYSNTGTTYKVIGTKIDDNGNYELKFVNTSAINKTSNCIIKGYAEYNADRETYNNLVCTHTITVNQTYSDQTENLQITPSSISNMEVNTTKNLNIEKTVFDYTLYDNESKLQDVAISDLTFDIQPAGFCKIERNASYSVTDTNNFHNYILTALQENVSGTVTISMNYTGKVTNQQKTATTKLSVSVAPTPTSGGGGN